MPVLSGSPRPLLDRPHPRPRKRAWACALLSFAWLGLPHAVRAQNVQSAPEAQDTPESCANEPWSEEVPNRSARALRIERTLVDAYTPPGEPARRTTGTLSAATLELMNRYCTDVRATGATVLASIDSLAEAQAAYPAWRDTIASPAFARWARSQPVGRYPGRIEDRLPRSPGAALLIDRYLAERTDGWYYLTADELKTLAVASPAGMYGVAPGSAGELSTRGAPQALVERVQALETLGYRYPSYDSVDVRLDAIFALDAAPVPQANDPKELDAALLIVADALAQADAAPATPPAAQYRDLVQIGLQRAADRGPSISAPALAGLQSIVGKRFPDAHLFKTAVRLSAGIGAAHPAELARIMSLARKPAPRTALAMADSLGLQPLAWDGGSCGCGVFEGGPDAGGQYYYGIYPFWAAPQRDSTLAAKTPIEFSQLTRVAYYGLTFDASGTLEDPLHWRMGRSGGSLLPFRGREYASFSIKAHDYKSVVDLVVYKSDWTPFLPSDTTLAAQDAAATAVNNAFGALRVALLDAISPQLPDFVDRIKPIVTLGQSPRSTLGDGVTLDFDFEGVSDADQARLFDLLEQADFFRGLRRDLALRGNQEKFFDMVPEYRVNLIVPAHCIGAFGTPQECAFYSMRNLRHLSETDSLNMFLADMNSQTGRDSTDISMLPLWDRARHIRAGIERMSDALGPTTARNFAYKLIPLAEPDAREVGPFFREIEPYFAGAGSWSLPTDPIYNDTLTAVFFPPPAAPTGLPLGTAWILAHVTTWSQSANAAVCGVMCPMRWWARLAILLGTIGFVMLWVLSEMDFRRKAIFESRPFLIFGLVMAALLLSTMWCDPFWDAHHGIILLAFVIVSVGSLVGSRTRLKRQRTYP